MYNKERVEEKKCVFRFAQSIDDGRIHLARRAKCASERCRDLYYFSLMILCEFRIPNMVGGDM